MITIAGVLVKKDGKYLLAQEKKQEVYGLWNIPAGHVGKGETNEEAALREGNEETGYFFKLIGKPERYMLTIEKELIVYSAEIISGEIRFNKEELLDVKWFTLSEIAKIRLREPQLKNLFV